MIKIMINSSLKSGGYTCTRQSPLKMGDMYPQCPGIYAKETNYAQITINFRQVFDIKNQTKGPTHMMVS